MDKVRRKGRQAVVPNHLNSVYKHQNNEENENADKEGSASVTEIYVRR